MAEFIEKTDTLNQGRVKINSAIKDAEDANEKATQALANSESTQTQLDTIVIDGDSSVEAAQARVDEKGEAHPTLKARIDDGFTKVTSQLAQTAERITQVDHMRQFESMINRKKVKRGMITIIDDDGEKGFYTKLRPLALEYGITFTSALITGVSRGFPGDNRTPNSKFMNYEEIMEIHQEGSAEFIGHSHTHPDLRTLPVEQIRDEFIKSQDFLKEYGFNHRSMVFPFNRVNQNVMNEVRTIFDYSFGNAPHGLVVPPFDNYYIPRNVIRFGENILALKNLIDLASANNEWVVIYTHVDQDGYIESDMREIIEYALSKNLEFVTSLEGIETHGNIAQLQTPKYTAFDPDNIDEIDIITAEGDLYGPNFGNMGTVRISKLGEYANNAPVTDFPIGKITRVKVRTIDAANYGLPGAGFIDVYRDDEIQYSYREYKRYKSPERKISYWDQNNNVWTDWEDWDTVRISKLGEYANNAPVTDFPIGKITRVKVRAADAGEYGLPGAGFIDIYRDDEVQYSYREYKRYKSPERKISYWDQNNNVWTDWQDF